jgi:hypothetical protein
VTLLKSANIIAHKQPHYLGGITGLEQVGELAPNNFFVFFLVEEHHFVNQVPQYPDCSC